MKQKLNVRTVAVLGMFVALSFVSVVLSKFIPNVAGFLSYEPKDALIVIAGFIFGPIACVIVSVLVSLIEMLTISSTGFYGLLMNVVSTCAFTVPAAWFYSRHKTQKHAVLGLCLGVVTMAACMLAWNYIITPYYMGVPREQVAGMLATTFLPFNLVKGGINAALALLLYKPIVTALRKARLIPNTDGGKPRFRWGFMLFSLAVLATFVLLLLVMIGVI